MSHKFFQLAESVEVQVVGTELSELDYFPETEEFVITGNLPPGAEIKISNQQ